MIQLRWAYYKDDQQVYKGNKDYVIKGADPGSFEVLSKEWSRDRVNVYCYSSKVPKADRETFTVLNDLYAKDKNAVFHMQGIVKEADAATFEVLDTARNNMSFARDKDHVFFHEKHLGKACVVKGADPATFQSLENGFGKDEQYVYYGRFKLPKADPTSWQLLPGLFSRDQRHVYYLNKLLTAADPQTFEVLPSDFHFARDKNHYYSMLEVRPAEEYLSSFRNYYIFMGTVQDAYVVDAARNRIGETDMDLNADQRVRIHVKCEEWLFHPATRHPDQPEVGQTLAFLDIFSNCLAGECIGKSWIWIFHADAHGNYGPLLSWEDFEPLANRTKVESLIACTK